MPDRSGEDWVFVRNRSAAGGVNGYAFATDIDDDQAVELTNVDAQVPGRRASRDGVSLVASGITFGPILSLACFQAVSKESELLAISPGAAFPAPANLRLWSWLGTSSTWSLIGQLTGLTSATMPVQIVVGTDLQSSSGKPYLARVFQQGSIQGAWVYDGTGLTFTAAAGAAPIAGMFPAAYQQNKCFASGGGVNAALVYFTDVAMFAMTGWNTSLSVTMGGGQRQLVKAIHPFRNTDLIIFMADRIDVLLLTDSFASGVGYTGWQRDVINTRIGCAGPNAVTNTGEDLLFVDQFFNVRSLNRTITDNQQGVKSLPLSTNISHFISRVNPVHGNKITAAFHDRFAFFGFPLDSATDVSHVFVLDVVTQRWYGPWTGKIPSKCMAVAQMSTPTVSAKYQDPGLYLGSSDTDSGKVYLAFDGTTDAGESIVYQEITKRFTLGQIETPKFFRRLHDLWEATSGESVLIEARKDGGEWSTIGTNVNLTGDSSIIPLTFPFSFGGAGIARKRFSLEDFGETPYDIQLRMTCTCTTKVKHLGFTLAAQLKNFEWQVD